MLLALLTPALLVAAAGCGTDTRVTPETATEGVATDAGTWERLPDLTLTRRAVGVAATVDGRVVVVGGDQGPPCPDTADCVDQTDHARDGAAYDDTTGRWEPIADAPRPITEYATHAVVGATLHVIGKDSSLLSYDAPADRWTVRDVPGRRSYPALSSDGDRLLVLNSSDEADDRPLPDLALGPDGWQRLPENPLGRLFDRQLVAAGDDLVLLGKRVLPGGGIEDPALLDAAVLRDGRWRELPRSRQLGGAGFVWTGGLLVDPTLGGADGGETDNYGEVLPFGGTLDPATGAWGRLRDLPGEGTGGWPAFTAGGSAAGHVARDGWLRSGLTGGWARIARPPGAPDQPGPATWLDDDLVVVGGQSLPEDDGPGGFDGWTADLYSPGAWVLRR